MYIYIYIAKGNKLNDNIYIYIYIHTYLCTYDHDEDLMHDNYCFLGKFRIITSKLNFANIRMYILDIYI